MSELEYRASQPVSLWRQNPVLTQLLGLSPVLAVSDSVAKGLGLGVVTALVMVASCATVSLLKASINHTWRFVIYLTILAGFTTVADIVMQWFYFPLYRELGIYIPLICCNFALILRLEVQASKLHWQPALRDAAIAGSGYVLAIILLASPRELLATGTLLHDWRLLIPATVTNHTEPSREWFGFVALQPGALILLGLLIAAKNKLQTLTKNSDEPDQQGVKPAKRARVTGQL